LAWISELSGARMISVIPSNLAYVSAVLSVVCAFVFIAAIFYLFGQRSALGYPVFWITGVGVLVAVLLASLALKGWVKIEDNIMTIYAPFSKTAFALSDLDVSRSVRRGERLYPRLLIRLMGVSLPGFKSGVFGVSGKRTVIVLMSRGQGVFVPGKSVDGRFDGLVLEKEAFDRISQFKSGIGIKIK